jgi:poly(hydroxyalkanoate) granule-associated protein
VNNPAVLPERRARGASQAGSEASIGMSAKDRTDTFEKLSASARKIWLAGLGAIAEAEKRGDEIFETLVESGESYEKNLKEPLGKASGAFRESVSTATSKATSALHDLEGLVDRKVTSAMKSMGLATRAEVESLRKEVERLKKSATKKRTVRKKKI